MALLAQATRNGLSKEFDLAPASGSALPRITPRHSFLCTALVVAWHAAYGVNTSDGAVSADGQRVSFQVDCPTKTPYAFTLQLIDGGDKAVLSGNEDTPMTAEESADIFDGIPGWIEAQHLAVDLLADRLEFCAWYEDGRWHHSAKSSDEVIRRVANVARCSASAAWEMSEATYAEENTQWLVDTYQQRLLGSALVQPITAQTLLDVLEVYKGRKTLLRDYIGYDATRAWEQLGRAGLQADPSQGPDELAQREADALYSELAEPGVCISLSESHHLVEWLGTPDAAAERKLEACIGRLVKLRRCMFRRTVGTWWCVTFSKANAGAVFLPAATPPPPQLILPPTRYGLDSQLHPSVVPEWVSSLLNKQVEAVNQRAPGSVEPVADLESFQVLIARWAGLAGVLFHRSRPDMRHIVRARPPVHTSATSDDHFFDRPLISSTPEGCLYDNEQGVRLRLAPISQGRAILSGTHSGSFKHADPASVVAGLPDWIGARELHAHLQYGALTFVWWWDGQKWECTSGSAIRSKAGLDEIVWLRSTTDCASAILQVCDSIGYPIQHEQCLEYVRTAETSFGAAAQMAPRIFDCYPNWVPLLPFQRPGDMGRGIL